MRSIKGKVLISLFTGILVAGSSTLTRMMLTNEFRVGAAYVPEIIAGLVSILIGLSIHLNYEGQYYRFALERAAVFSELNHHVRNAVFPLCLEVHRTGDARSIKMSDEAIERINLVLREAVTDVFGERFTQSQLHERENQAA